MSRTNKGNNPANPHQQNIKRSIMSRVRVLYAVFAVIAVAIFAMILVTQYGPNGTPLRNRSDLKCYKTIEVPASRGNIYSHDGRILATDSPSYNLSLDFTVLDMSDEEFGRLSAALADSLSRTIPGYSKDYFLRRLREIRAKALRGGPGSQNQRLVRDKVNQIQLDRIKTFPIFDKGRLGGGLIYTQDAERYKPYGTLAARTLGKPGEFGLEASFDDALSGSNGRNLCVRLVRDIWVPVVSKENIEAKNGRDLLTTIDVDMQDIVESELRKQILDKNATCGTAVIMEVKTGEIRAISNLTRYGSTVRDDENHAVTMRCEPGSTFKLVSLMALIDEAGYGLDYPVDCTENGRYYYQVGRRKYLVQDSHAVGQTDLLGVMEHSSNIGFVKVIDEEYHDSPERFVDFIHSLGIDRQVNMQLNGGLKPIIKDPRRKKETAWDALSLMKMSYGYAVEVTPIHTLMLYNAVANDGHMVAPRLVTAVMENGHAVERFGTETVNRKICSDKTLPARASGSRRRRGGGNGLHDEKPELQDSGQDGYGTDSHEKQGIRRRTRRPRLPRHFRGVFPRRQPALQLHRRHQDLPRPRRPQLLLRRIARRTGIQSHRRTGICPGCRVACTPDRKRRPLRGTGQGRRCTGDEDGGRPPFDNDRHRPPRAGMGHSDAGFRTRGGDARTMRGGRHARRTGNGSEGCTLSAGEPGTARACQRQGKGGRAIHTRRHANKGRRCGHHHAEASRQLTGPADSGTQPAHIRTTDNRR